MSNMALNQYLAPLMPYLNMDGLTELSINQPLEIYIEIRGVYKHYSVPELSLKWLETLAALIAEYNFTKFPAPLLSGSLPNGNRVHIAMYPACEKGKIVFSIRCQISYQMSLDDYEKKGAFEQLMNNSRNAKSTSDLDTYYHEKNYIKFLKTAVLEKKNILISGGTGTGKTTFLNACLRVIPINERIITVEDTREVKLAHNNSVHLLFNEKDDRITSLNVFKSCLRLRPDRILLSELRGAEVWPFLRAANSGHPGSITTVHADSPEGALTQLVFMMQQAGSTSTEDQMRAYLRSIIQVVVQLKRHSDPNKFMYVEDIWYQLKKSIKSPSKQLINQIS